jgi:hypothetical protein
MRRVARGLFVGRCQALGAVAALCASRAKAGRPGGRQHVIHDESTALVDASDMTQSDLAVRELPEIAGTPMWASRGEEMGEDEVGVPETLSTSEDNAEEPAEGSNVLLGLGRDSLVDRLRASIEMTLLQSTMSAQALREARIAPDDVAVSAVTTRMRTILECELPLVLAAPAEDDELELLTQSIADVYAAGFRPHHTCCSVQHYTRIMPFWIANKKRLLSETTQLRAVAAVSSQVVDEAFLVVSVRLHQRSVEDTIVCWSNSLLKLTRVSTGREDVEDTSAPLAGATGGPALNNDHPNSELR